MNLATNFNNWADNTKKKVTSTFNNAKSSIGDWLDKTYNNKETASKIKTPSLYITGNLATSRDTGYNPSRDTYKTINPVYNPSTDKSKTTTLKAYQQNKDKTTAVENIQKSLNTLGYKDTSGKELKVDGVMGPLTQTNWNKFTSDRGSFNHLYEIPTALNQVDNIKKAYNSAKDWLDENGEDLSNAINLPLGIATKNLLLAGKGIDGGLGLAARNTDKTYAVGLQGSAFGPSVSIGYAVDPDGNRAIVTSETAAGGTPNLFGGIYESVSSADNINQLGENGYELWNKTNNLNDYIGNPSITTGGSVFLGGGASAGLDYNFSSVEGENGENIPINSVSLSGGIGWKPIPVEMHGGTTFSQVYDVDELWHWLKNK